MDQWRYKTVVIEFRDDVDLDMTLDQYGKDAWELVSTHMVPTGGAIQKIFCVFKRPSTSYYEDE